MKRNMYSITQYGKELEKSLYTIDEENKTFTSKETNLVLDLVELDCWTFKTGSNCTFTTGEHCTYCTFKTGSYCVFKTGYGCVFTTGSECAFNTGSGCVFKTGDGCTFKTGWNCIFKNGTNCVLLGYDLQRFRYFLDNSNYAFTSNQLIEIKDKNQAILNMKHENKYVRNLCKDILKGN